MSKRSSVFTTLGANNHVDHDYETDGYYATDPIAVDKLAEKFDIPHKLWEPMCGEGHLSKRLIELGHDVYSSDLINRGYGDAPIDFLNVEQNTDRHIITNPSYKIALETVHKGLQLINEGNYVILFLKITFLEGKKRKKELFDQFPPKYVFVSSQRIRCAIHGDFSEVKSSAAAYAWFVWKKGDYEKTEVHWL